MIACSNNRDQRQSHFEDFEDPFDVAPEMKAPYLEEKNEIESIIEHVGSES